MIRYFVYVAILLASFVTMTSGEIGMMSIDGTRRETWYSKPFDHKCLLDCTHELVKHTTHGDVAIRNRTCSVECNRKSTQQHRYRKENFKRVQVQDPVTGHSSECLVGVLVEDIFCARVSSPFSGVRKLEIENNQQCRRRNYRYYLPHSKCDAKVQQATGEESCETTCIRDNDVEYVVGKITSRISVDVERVRAKYQVCYDGRVSESYRFPQRTSGLRRSWHFCRAELIHCSSCFRWGNWTAQTSCSRTCGSYGIATFYRQCEIKKNQGNNGSPVKYTRVAEAYCKAYFGGTPFKTESCGSDVPCPEWSQWGAWSGCLVENQHHTPPTTVPPPGTERYKKNCISGRRQRKVKISGFVPQPKTVPENSTAMPGIGATVSSAIGENFKRNLLHKMHPTLKGAPNTLIETRKRKCIHYVRIADSGCSGNSTQNRECPPILVPQSGPELDHESNGPTDSAILEEDCEEHEYGTQSTTGTEMTTTPTEPEMVPTTREKTTREIQTAEVGTTTSLPVDTVHESHARTTTLTKPDFRLATITSQKVLPDLKPRPNNNFTLTDDGFTSVLSDYAPALIAALLVFIVLLLIALIAVCGTRIMQKNSNTAYDVTSPSFSAGTVGSIPSGLVHGFSHTLGLRSGSGTFGRSISTINGVGVVNDAVSSRGSCKSVTSATSGPTGKATTVQQQKRNAPHPQQTAPCKAPLAKNSPHTLVPLQTAVSKVNNKYTATSITNRKPSSSSLLSTSSTCTSASAVPVNSCSFQPLPPIPLDQVPYPPPCEEISSFRRGTGRSSSLTPVEQDNKARQSRNGTRCESVGGRVGGKSHMFSRESGNRRGHHHAADKTAKNAWASRPKGFQSSSGRSGRYKDRSDQTSSDGYCKHTCEEMACGLAQAPRGIAASTENEYWSVARREYLDSGTESSDSRSTAGASRNRERKALRSKKSRENRAEDIPMDDMREAPVPKCKIGSKKWFGGNAEVEMVDNVLYAVTSSSAHPSDCNDSEDVDKELKEYNMLDFSSSGEGSVRSHLGSCGEERPSHGKLRAARSDFGGQFYNKIELDDSSKGSDASATNDDDYDHLCDQFGAPYISRPKTKYQGTMTSLHQLRQHSFEVDSYPDQKEKPHDYECIEFDENLQNTVLDDVAESDDEVEDTTNEVFERKGATANRIGERGTEKVGTDNAQNSHKYVNTHRCVTKSDDLASS